MELWTYQHAITLLPALGIMILIAVLLRHTIGKRDDKIRRIPLQILSIILLVLEVGKQVVSFTRGYDLYHIPLHFCSLFLVTMPLAAFYKGKYVQQVRAINAAFCTAMTVLLLIYPALIYSHWNVEGFFNDYLHMHTVAFHNLVMFACILQLTLDLHVPISTKQDLRAVAGFTFGYCVIASVVAQILQVNFNNFYSCNIAPLEELRLSLQNVLGYGVTQLLYVLIVITLNMAFVFGSYWLYRGIHRLIAGKTPVAC